MKYTVTWSLPKKFEQGNFGVDVEGVYLIGYRDAATDKRHPVYVGQGDVGSRLADHFRNNDCIERRLNYAARVGYYRYEEVEDEDDWLDIELGLYEKYGSSKLCNEIEPAGSGRYRTIEVEGVFSSLR